MAKICCVDKPIITITMPPQKTAEEKIQSVLECIKEQYDISPKESYSTSAGMSYSYRHKKGEIKLATHKLMYAGNIDFYELEKILAKLQEDGLIKSFKVASEFS